MSKQKPKERRLPDEPGSEKRPRRPLTAEELERRIAPSAAGKKLPIPPPYAPGTDYGLVRRDNLRW